MPGRKYSASNSYYRYSINGQEKVSELSENITTAEYWEYDSRIGRRWNVDPETKVGESPYLCFSGNPIYNTDVLGNVSKGLNDWIKKKKADGTTEYKWDDKAKSQETTPADYQYVGTTHKYDAGNNVVVNLYNNGIWYATSGVTASSGSKDVAPPAEPAPPSGPVTPLLFKPAPRAFVGPVGYTFDNDFDRGMVQNNIATNASVMLLAPASILGKLAVNTSVQVAVNGKNADVADILINSFSPFSYANQWGTAVLDWKPFSVNPGVRIFPYNKDPLNFALDLGLNHVFYGFSEGQKKIVTGFNDKVSAKVKLALTTFHTTSKAVVKKTYNDGFFQQK